VVLLVAGSGVPAVFAQEARVSGSFGGSFGDGGTAPVVAASAGYQFDSHVGLEVELVAIPHLNFGKRFGPVPLAMAGVISVPPVPCPFPLCGGGGFVFSTTGRALSFTTNMVGEFPTGLRWFRPYVFAGGGVGHVARTVRESFQLLSSQARQSGVALPSVIVLSPQGELDLALTTGGGVDFQLLNHLALGGEVRYLHLFGTIEGLNMTRVGARVSARF